MAVTRIQNNQITDSTINAQYKVQSGTVTGNLFATNLTLNSNVTILGNFTVANSYTQLNSVNTYVNDPLVVFNNGYTGSPTYDIGVLMNRNLQPVTGYGGQSVNAAWVWEESSNQFQGILTTETGTTTGVINNSGYANLRIGNVFSISQTVTNGLSAGSLTTGGALTVSGASALNTVTGASFQGIIGNSAAAAGTFTTLTASSATVNGTVIANTVNAVTIGNTGANINGTGTYLTALNASNLSSGTVPSAQISGAYTGITQVGTLTGLTTSGTIIAATVNAATIGNSGAVFSGASETLTGTLIAATVNAATIGNTGATGTFQTLNSVYSNPTNLATSNAVITGGSVNGTPVGATVASTGNFTTLNATTSITTATVNAATIGNAGAVFSGASETLTGTLIAATVNAATIGNTGANLVGTGTYITGLSSSNISGTVATANVAINVQTNLNVDTTNAHLPIMLGNTATTGNSQVGVSSNLWYDPATQYFNAPNLSTGSASGTVATNILNAAVGASNVTVFNTTTANINMGGAATIVALGASNVNFNVGGGTGNISAGNVTATTLYGNFIGTAALSTLTTSSTIIANGNIVAASGTASSNTTTGALVVAGTGGLGVGGAVYAGSVYDSGNRVLSTSSGAGNLAISGNAVTLPLTGPGAVSVGSATNIPTIQTDQYGRIVSLTSNAVSTGFSLVGTSGSGTLSGGGTLTFASTNGVTIAVGSSYANISTPQDVRTTASPSFVNTTLSGTLIAATVNAATIGNTGASFSGANQTLSGTLIASTVNAATIGNTGAAFTGSSATITGTTQSTNTTSGALQVTGGVGIGANLYVGGNATIVGNLTVQGTVTSVNSEIVNQTEVVAGTLTANSTVAATNTTSGALQVAGGVGIQGAVYAGSIQNTPIGNTTASTGAFTTLTSSGTTIASGNIVAASGTASTSATTGALVVAGSGGAGIGGNLNVAGLAYFTDNIPNTGVNTGALQVTQGGAYIAGNLFVGGNINLTNTNTTQITGNNGSFYGNAAGFGALFTGISSGYVVQAQTVIQASTNFNGYAQINHQNINSGANASTDFVATADTGTAGSGYIDMGINSSGFVGGSGNELNYPLDGYVYVQGTSNSNGNLILSTEGATDVVITTNGQGLVNQQARFKNNVGLIIYQTTTSTNTTSGALQVAGGAGIAGAVYAGSIQNTPIGSTAASTGNFTTLNASTGLTASTVSAATIGNVGASGQFGTIIASTVNAATIGNTGATITGASETLSGTLIAATVNAATIGNTGAVFSGANQTLSGTLIAATVNAATIGNTGATVTGTNVNGVYVLASTGLSTANAVITGGSINGTTIGATNASTGNFTTLNATTSVTTATVNAATIGNTGANVVGTGTYLTSLTGSNVNGTVNTANVSYYKAVQNVTNNQTFYLGFANATSGNSTFNTTTTVNVNPSTGNVYATAFVGSGAYLTNISIGSLSGTYPAANAAIYTGVTNNTSGSTFYPILSGQSTTGNVQAQVNGSLSYVPNTGTLSAVAFSGSGTSYIQTLQVNGAFTGCGTVAATSGASSTSTATGALQVTGGVGVTGNIYVGGTGVFGSSLNYTPANAPIQVGYSINNYSQFTIQNANAGNNASTDIAAVANNGSDNDTYVDMGIVSSGYSQAAYSLYKPNDGYLIVAGNTTTGGGNLILNTYKSNDIIFATGGTTTQFEVARITSGNVVVIKSTNNNTLAANTGALQVWGGASVSGNVYIGGSSYYMGGALFNHNQASAGTTGGANQNAFIMQGVNDSTLIYAKPLTAYDAVIIGGNAASTSFAQGAKFVVNSTDSMLLPVGTNAQRPGSSGGTDTTGMFRYSSTANAIEWYNGTSWQSASSSFTVIADQQFTGTGSQTNFTLSTSQTTASCIVSINGVVQIPTLAYSVSGTTLTFTEAPQTTDVIDVRMLTTTATVLGLSDVSGYNQVNVATGTGITFVTGTTQATTQYTIDTNGGFVTNGSNVTIASAGTSVIDNLYANTYSSAKYTITATLAGTTIREITEVLMVHTGNGAGAGSVYMSSYGRVNTAGNTLVTYSGSTSGNIAQLQATTTNANTILRIKRDYMAI